MIDIAATLAVLAVLQPAPVQLAPIRDRISYAENEEITYSYSCAAGRTLEIWIRARPDARSVELLRLARYGLSLPEHKFKLRAEEVSKLVDVDGVRGQCLRSGEFIVELIDEVDAYHPPRNTRVVHTFVVGK